MRFPPPVRFTAPLVALVFGLAATWFDYRLNLDLDLARHFDEMRKRADSNGSRLARASARLLAMGDRDALQTRVETVPDRPEVEIVGVVDDTGKVIADSTNTLSGQAAAATPLAPAALLINAAAKPIVQHGKEAKAVVSAHPFHIGENGTGWALLVLDRAEAIADAQADARTQLTWMASAMALLSFALWAVLHFAFAMRLGRLVDSVIAFGEGKMAPSALPEGGDEVGRLSRAFSTMAAKLRERDAEKVELEREVIETSEHERRRIGHDLHDGLGQRLTAASMATNALVMAAHKSNVPALAERAEEIGQQLRAAIAEARALSHGLAPVELKDDGLMQALHALAEATALSTGVRCVFECPATAHVPDDATAVHLYRIAQEAVNNALKHAAPSEIRIGLEPRNGMLVLEVDDDGAGLQETLGTGSGIGLRVMRHRTELAGGSFDIGSPPAGGTRVSCRVKLTS